MHNFEIRCRMLRLPRVIEMTGLQRDSIYRLARQGKFPKPFKITERLSAWREDEIATWIAERPLMRQGAVIKRRGAA